MIQVTSGDGWMTDIVRPMHSLHDDVHDMFINLFFLRFRVWSVFLLLRVLRVEGERVCLLVW